MPENFFNGVLYGPRGPETRRWKDDTWGPSLVQAVAGNDDENIVEKTRILGKYTFLGATTFAIADLTLLHNKGGLPVALQRLKFHYVPWMGGTLAYTAAVAASCSLRGGKSDHWNHVIGGFAVGAVIGKCARHVSTGILTGAVFAGFAFFYKEAAIKGYELFPDVQSPNALPRDHGNPFSHKWDFTTIKRRMGERPGYWCRTPEEVEKVFKQGQLGDGNTTDRQW